MSMILRSMKENFSFFLLTAIDFLFVHRRWRCSSRMNYAVNSFSRSFDFFNWMNGQFDCLFLIASIQWLCQVDHFSLIRSFSSSQNIHHFLIFFLHSFASTENFARFHALKLILSPFDIFSKINFVLRTNKREQKLIQKLCEWEKCVFGDFDEWKMLLLGMIWCALYVRVVAGKTILHFIYFVIIFKYGWHH